MLPDGTVKAVEKIKIPRIGPIQGKFTYYNSEGEIIGKDTTVHKAFILPECFCADGYLFHILDKDSRRPEKDCEIRITVSYEENQKRSVVIE